MQMDSTNGNSFTETAPASLNEVRGNIYLVGMMGAGKTTIGRLLAAYLGKTFFDSDREIQKRTGVSIPVIFEIEGEAGFRRRETDALLELVKNNENIVLATGGGAVLSPANREVLKGSGTVVYLRATVDDLWRRTRQDKNRPLLQTEEPRGKLAELYKQRDPLYRDAADLIVESGRRSARHLAHLLVRQLVVRASNVNENRIAGTKARKEWVSADSKDLVP
jgi:shikimate kinase